MEEDDERNYQETRLDGRKEAEAPPTDGTERERERDGDEAETSRSGGASSAPFTRHQKITFLGAALATFSSMLAFSIIAVFFPIAAESKGMSQSVIGLVFSSFSVSSTIGSVIWGKVIPIIGARFVFLAGCFVTGACNVLFGFIIDMPNTATFTTFAFLIRIMEGLGTSATWTSSGAISAYAFPNNVGTVVSLIEMISGLSFATGPAIGGLLYNASGFRMPFFVLGGFVLATFSVNFFLMPQQGKKDEKSGSVLQVLSIPAVWVVLTSVLVASLALSIVDPTLSLRLKYLRFSVIGTSFVFVSLGMSYAIFSVLWGSIADVKKATRIMITLGIFGVGVFFLLLGPSPLLKITPSKLLVILVMPFGGVVIGLVSMPTFVDMFSSAEWYGVPTGLGLTSVIMGLWTAAFSLGTIAGPILGGYLVEQFGFGQAMTFIAGVCFLVMICICLFGVWEYRCGKGRRVPRKRLEHEATSTDDPESKTPLLSRDV